MGRYATVESTSLPMMIPNTSWPRRRPASKRTQRTFLWGALLLLYVTAAVILTQAQERSWDRSYQTAVQSSNQESEFIAPGIEHLQITRGYKSDKEADGPWFINMLRIDLSRARLQLVHAMDEAVGLETTSSMAARHGALAAVNSGYFRTTGTYRGDSVGVEVLDGKLLSEPNNVRAAVGLIERRLKQSRKIRGRTQPALSAVVPN